MQCVGLILVKRHKRDSHGHPITRLGTPDDLAFAALFLASDAAWVTGVIFDLAGGAVVV